MSDFIVTEIRHIISSHSMSLFPPPLSWLFHSRATPTASLLPPSFYNLPVPSHASPRIPHLSQYNLSLPSSSPLATTGSRPPGPQQIPQQQARRTHRGRARQGPPQVRRQHQHRHRQKSSSSNRRRPGRRGPAEQTPQGQTQEAEVSLCPFTVYFPHLKVSLAQSTALF